MIFAYVTFPALAEAEAVAGTVVSEHLAACANIFPGMTSVYRWNGSVEKSTEVTVIFKTREELWLDLERRIRTLHSYDTPCIVAFPLTKVSNGFMKWMISETER